MKIGIDARLWNETGVGRYIRSLFRYLSHIDGKNEYVWFFGKKEYAAIEMPSPRWRKVLSSVHWHTLREQLVLPYVFWKEKLDLLHFPYFTFPILYPGRFVVTIHDLIFDHYKSGRASTLPGWLYLIKKAGYHLVNWVSVHRAEKIFTLSHNAKGEIVTHYKASPAKVVPTYEAGGLEDKRRGFAGKEFARMRNFRPYLLYVGNAHPHKNVERLVAAMGILRGCRGFQGFRLVLVGSDQFFYPRLEEYIRKIKAGQYVEVIGEVPNAEIAAWYHFAKALVTASQMEGFGIPPLEAMSVGCPAIVSDIPVFHEVCGDAAAYFNQNDPEDIVRVIKKTLGDVGGLRKMRERGYRQAAKYSWEKMVRETAEVYKQVLENF